MKSIVYLFAALLSANALGTSIQFEKDFTLKHVTINGEDQGYVAVAHMDYREETIDVKIFKDPCGTLTAEPGQPVCRMPAQIMDTLFVSWESNKAKCNAYVYKGSEDNLRADGHKIVLRAVDWSAKSGKGSCAGIRLKGLFTVKATKESLNRNDGSLIKKSYDLF